MMPPRPCRDHTLPGHEDSSSAPPLVSERFRHVLGHFPTGVVVVTAIAADGQALGMTIGSFTAVSLDPPLVAFLPGASSATFAAMRSCTSVVINVLAAEQEPICRRFASKAADRFDGTPWRPAPSGAPVLDGVVAWIDCDLTDVVPAGDHVIAMCLVRHLEVASSALPLLFFQGGYGKFSPSSLAAGTAPDLVGLLRMVDLARPRMEALSAELDLDLTAQCFSMEESVVMASASPPHSAVVPSRVGWRLPLVPPVGSVLMAWAPAGRVESWLSALQPTSKVTAAQVRESLAIIRARGYSVAAAPSFSYDLHLALDSLDETDHATRRRILRQFVDQMDGYDPTDLDEAAKTGLHHVAVPVFDPSDQPIMALNAVNLPSGLTADDTQRIAGRLRIAAGDITTIIRDRSSAMAPTAISV